MQGRIWLVSDMKIHVSFSSAGRLSGLEPIQHLLVKYAYVQNSCKTVPIVVIPISKSVALKFV